MNMVITNDVDDDNDNENVSYSKRYPKCVGKYKTTFSLLLNIFSE